MEHGWEILILVFTVGGWSILIINSRIIARRYETWTLFSSTIQLIEQINSEARQYWSENDTLPKVQEQFFTTQLATLEQRLNILSNRLRHLNFATKIVFLRHAVTFFYQDMDTEGKADEIMKLSLELVAYLEDKYQATYNSSFGVHMEQKTRITC